MTIVDRAAFAPYFDGLHPLLAVTIVVGAGALALARLERVDLVLLRHPLRGMRLAVGAALLFAVPTIGLDAATVPFSAAINVRFPASLLFYPVMAVVVEILFHAVPLALLAPLLRPGEARSRRLWACVILVALLEPAFQVALAGPIPGWLSAYLALHLFAFSVVQLWLFIRHDFVTMLVFRLSYYLCWHILWGHLRIQLLF
ncbi:MAG: hypothetical protein R3B72_33440 [Polyangiaceae bacterium]